MGHPSIQRIKEITGYRPYTSRVIDFLESGNGLSPNIKNLYRDQKKIINFIDQNQSSVIIARRRIGLTTAVLSYMVHDFLTKRDQLMAITASNTYLATYNYMQFIDMVMYKMSPAHKVVNNNRTLFELNNGSKMIVLDHESGFRGRPCTHIFHDSFDGDSDAESKLQAYYHMTAFNTKIVIGTAPGRLTKTSMLFNNSGFNFLTP